MLPRAEIKHGGVDHIRIHERPLPGTGISTVDYSRKDEFSSAVHGDEKGVLTIVWRKNLAPDDVGAGNRNVDGKCSGARIVGSGSDVFASRSIRIGRDGHGRYQGG